MAINAARPSASLLSSSVLLLLIATATSTGFGNVLKGGERLNAGQILSIGSYKFTMQEDCNLVLYDKDEALWASNTQGMGDSCITLLQANGELAIISGSGSLVWRSETGGAFGKYALVLQPNGNVVVYGNPLWSTGTHTQRVTVNAQPKYSPKYAPKYSPKNTVTVNRQPKYSPKNTVTVNGQPKNTASENP